MNICNYMSENGALVDLYVQGNTKILVENSIHIHFFLIQKIFPGKTYVLVCRMEHVTLMHTYTMNTGA